MYGTKTAAARGRRAAVALAVAVNACATSALAAVLPVFLTTYLRASYFEASLFMVVGTLATSVATYVFGKIGDVPHLRYPITISAALCGLAGAMTLAFATSYWSFLLVFASLMAVAGSLFSQLMALAFIYDRSSTAIIRAVASGGWVVGPPLGGLIATLQSPTTLFYSIAATYAFLVLVLLTMALCFSQTSSEPKESFNTAYADRTTHQGSIFVVVFVLAAIHFLISICALGIPWRIVQIGGSEYHVGLAFSIAAAVEVPIIACSNFIRARAGYGRTVFISSTMLFIYFFAASFFGNLAGMISISVINGMVTGIMMGLSLIILQERMSDRPAYASSIYANIIRLSYVSALLVAGGIAQEISVVAIFWVAGALALCLSFGLALGQPLGPISTRLKRPHRLGAS